MRVLIVFTFLIIGLGLNAQTLFSIEGEDVSVDEFKRMYEKNLMDKSQSYKKGSVDEYFNLFVNYKLKLQEAQAQGLYDDPKVKKEIKQYEEQLIKSTFDKAIMNDLLEEAYERSKEEICISHILINVRNNPSPQDTLSAYKEAMEVRNLLSQGADFASLARRRSSDTDSKFDGGELGCFTTLQVASYAIENAAYGLQKGQLSLPVRSSWGYHIIRCDERRSATGEVSVAQIFVRANSFQKDSLNAEARTKIYEAYTELKSEKFEKVVAEYSEDATTKNKGGRLAPFSVGTYEADFESAVFALKELGDISKPIKTRVGWHIFKLLEKEPVPTFEEVKTQLREKIINDERYEQANKRYGNTLKAEYGYERNDENLNSFRKEVAPGITIRGWQVPTSYPTSNVFFALGESEFTAGQFINFVRKEHKRGRFLSFKRFYENFESENLLTYHRNHIADEDSSLGALLQEYKDGIVLFSLMDKEIWSKQQPSEGQLMNYYKENGGGKPSEDLIKVKEYTATNFIARKKLKKMLNKNASEATIQKLNRKKPGSVTMSEKTIAVSSAFINGKDLTRMGTVASTMTENGQVFMKSYERIAGKKESFEDVRGDVLADYQKNVEKDWIDKLKAKYTVEIDTEVLKSLYE